MRQDRAHVPGHGRTSAAQCRLLVPYRGKAALSESATIRTERLDTSGAIWARYVRVPVPMGRTLSGKAEVPSAARVEIRNAQAELIASHRLFGWQPWKFRAHNQNHPLVRICEMVEPNWHRQVAIGTWILIGLTVILIVLAGLSFVHPPDLSNPMSLDFLSHPIAVSPSLAIGLGLILLFAASRYPAECGECACSTGSRSSRRDQC